MRSLRLPRAIVGETLYAAKLRKAKTLLVARELLSLVAAGDVSRSRS